MRSIATGVALLALAAAPALPTGPAAHATSFTCQGLGRDVQISDRLDPADARFAITTEGGEVTLLLTDHEVAVQLSARTLRRVHRELRDARNEQDHWLASTIVTAVAGAVRQMLDHSFVCDVSDLRDVKYEDGRLVFIGRHGKAMFMDEDGGDSDFCRAFSERDARNFVREFRLVKSRN